MAQLPHLARVVILGRPNVGKSTLFNRLCGRRRALVGDEPGMTRDRLYAPAEWLGKQFEVVDTGGMIPSDKELIPGEILRQVRVAIGEAAHLLLVVDARSGAVPLDEELAQLLRRTGKPLTLVVNKVDSPQSSALAADVHRLGIRDVFPVSAEHGLGIDDLLDHVTGSAGFQPADVRTHTGIPAYAGMTTEKGGAYDDSAGQSSAGHSFARHAINVAIIGRPNVGKSTLLNRLLNRERAIVTPLPGTTRDAVDAEVEREGRRFRFIDTAGIRRKGKTRMLAEKLSVIQARRHLERSDVALLVLDATEGVTALDTHIGGYAHESHRSVVIVVNKWDAAAKHPRAMPEHTARIREEMKYLDYAPIVFVSALTGERLGKLVSTIAVVASARRRRVPTAEMNRFVERLDFDRASSPGKPLRLYYLTQAGVAPPTFVAFINSARKLHFSVERFLENRIRGEFGFAGTPIVIKSRDSGFGARDSGRKNP